jgi:dephospho-CoA kinase
VLNPDGSLDRGSLRNIVFEDATARKCLEGIVHPEVGRLREAAFAEAEARGARLVVADIPLLFEAGLDREFDVIVLVDAPEELRLRRLVHDRGLGTAEARRMIEAQMPSEEKRSRADIVIENADSKQELQAAARTVWAELERRAGSGGGGNG